MEGEGSNNNDINGHALIVEARSRHILEDGDLHQPPPADGIISTEACFVFFATTMATFGATLAQISVFQDIYDVEAEQNLAIDASNWRQRRRRNNAIGLMYMHIMYYFLVLWNQVGNRREITGEWYIKPRSRQWFVMFLHALPEMDPEHFKQFFRISPTLFGRICEIVHDDLLTDPLEHFKVLPNRVLIVQRQVALALRRLCIGDNFLGIAELFGVSKSTAVKVTWRFIQAVKRRAGHFLRWPSEERLQQVKEGFLTRGGFPNCCGAIDGTHFPVELPAGESSLDYFDYKHNVLVSMQAIVDMDLRFLDVVAGWPGAVQDSRLLRRSRFFAVVVYRRDRLQGMPYICPDGTQIKEYILGDSGYPLYEWLIVPFPCSLENLAWNTIHSSTCMVVERAFGRLKGTWQVLSRILFKLKMERIGPMIYACCVLHNMIINYNDGLSSAIYEGFRVHPHGYGGVAVPNQGRFEGGPQVRNAIQRETLRLRYL